VILKGLGPRSVNHGGEPCRLIFAQGLQTFKLHITALQGPLVILFKHHGADQADDGGVVGENADDIGSAFHLGVQTFERIGAVDLGSMGFRESHESEHLMLCVVHHGS
jgi:hypothetical protein